MTASPWLDVTDADDLNLIISVWIDAPTDEDGEATLALYLGAAQQQCIDYLDQEIADDTEIPANWKLALIMQTRALWQAAITDPQGQVGQDGYRVTIYPMDWTVKNLLKPKSSKVRVR